MWIITLLFYYYKLIGLQILYIHKDGVKVMLKKELPKGLRQVTQSTKWDGVSFRSKFDRNCYVIRPSE